LPKVPSSLGRALIAVFVMAGFYLLALGSGCLLIYLPFGLAAHRFQLPIHLAVLSIATGGLILWSVVPRVDRFQVPGLRLLPEKQPRLFATLREIASATSQAMPSEVYLVGDVNAWVAQRGGVLAVGSRRVMGLGLPLLQVLSTAELRAVLAHEFGHYYGGDTKLGPWVYKTRAAIIRTISSLESYVDVGPFIAYGKLFVRVAHAVSRTQEASADALAARTVGADHLKSGLMKIETAAPAFQAFWREEMLPPLQHGYRLPLAQGFLLFLESPRIVETARIHLASALGSSESRPDATTTHPPLRERIAALGGERGPQTEAGESAAPAISLLENLDGLELELLLQMTGPIQEPLKPLDWDDVGETIIRPIWRRVAQAEYEALRHVTTDTIPATLRAPEPFIERLADPRVEKEPDPAKRLRAAGILQLGLGAALAARGWTYRSLPAEPVELYGRAGKLVPREVIEGLATGTMRAESWIELCSKLSISGLPLGVPPETPSA
jgi:heat shock protein HtpX